MKVAVHNSWEELRPLAQPWNALLASSASDTIFLTWEWCDAWWKNYGSQRSLYVLTAWEGSELAGVAPFYIDRQRRWGRAWNCLRVMGDGSRDSDYLDCFAAPGSERTVMAAVTSCLQERRENWDWIDLHGTPENSPCLATMLEEARQRQWKSAAEKIPCASLALPAKWEDYLKLLQPRFRTKVRSCLSQLEHYLQSAPMECRSERDLDEWLPLFFELHGRRWQNRNRPGVFRDDNKRRFYRDISRAALHHGWLAFHRLDWGEHPLALQYGFRYRNRFFLLQEAYDPSFEILRPGVTLRAWLLQHWIRQGLKEYDFLAGAAAYKMDWAAEQKTSLRVVLAPDWSGAWAAIDLPRVNSDLRDKIRALVPSPILANKKRLLDWRDRRQWNRQQPPVPVAKRALRWTASQVYRRTPLGSMARYAASHYRLKAAPSVSDSLSRLQRRMTPACHIFMYHRVNDERDPFFYAFPVSVFRAQMEHLARHFHVITLDRIADRDFPNNGDKYCAAVTFDDGYRDNYLCALPILKELGIPATVFLATGYIDTGVLPWYDQVRLAFKLTEQARLDLGEIGGPKSHLNTPALRLQALAQSLTWLRGLEESARLAGLRELFRTLRAPRNLTLPKTMLSWDEVRRMSKQNITFGAHTITHPVLAGVDRQRLENEISGSKKEIENRLQLAVRHFAYPFGKHSDFSPQAKEVVQAAGFETAVTTISGVNDVAQDLLELKRFCLREADPGIFGLKLDWYRMSARATG